MFVINAEPEDGYEKSLIFLNPPGDHVWTRDDLGFDVYKFTGGGRSEFIAECKTEQQAQAIYAGVASALANGRLYYDVYHGADPAPDVVPVPWASGAMILSVVNGNAPGYMNGLRYKDGTFLPWGYWLTPASIKLDFDSTFRLFMTCVYLGIPFFNWSDMEANQRAILKYGTEMRCISMQPREK